MSLWNKIVDMAGGSIVTTMVDTVKDYFPPSMSDQEKSDLEIRMKDLAHTRELALLNATNHMEAEFNNRIKAMEGTAKDLQQFGWLGRIIIFLRGLQRPTWGFAVLYMDYSVFSGQWDLVPDSQQDTAFFVINLLVLGFLFGERAIKNVSPLIERMIRR